MAVITRWSYKRGGRKAGFHCISLSLGKENRSLSEGRNIEVRL